LNLELFYCTNDHGVDGSVAKLNV